jgi:hypothetical protein
MVDPLLCSRAWLVACVLALSCGWRARALAQVPAPARPLAGAQVDVVEALLARMTLEEKLGQLGQWAAGDNTTGPTAAAGTVQDIEAPER